VETFTYPLPNDRIAQVPLEPRSAARLLVATDPLGGVDHRTVADLPELLGPGDLLVLNETRVLPARLLLQKATGGRVEVFVLALGDDGRGTALVRPSRKVAAGTVLRSGDQAVVEVGEDQGEGERAIRMLADLSAYGVVPLPPYIEAPLADPERYQTVYAARPGSVAAPTAGLHLTTEVLDACRARGAEIATVDLTVGLATFKPITVDRVEDHRMHFERYAVPPATLAAAERARRVLAVGTTTVRALESAALGQLTGETDLFIRAPFAFRLVDVLLTNFHMPRSSLLVLLDAFCGDRWRALYDTALQEGYRFLSFGDAMLVSRR
jgi:S-adenosylmethionine:tRNA ribosyltransferase-isomerase